MNVKIVKLLNLIRFRLIGTILLSITISVNAIEVTAPNIDYRFIIPILVMGTILLWPLIRGRRIVSRIYRKSMNKYKSRLKVCVNDTLRMYKNDDIRMYNFDCITDTIVEVIITCNTYTLLTVHLL